MSMNRGSSMENVLIEPVTDIVIKHLYDLDILTPKAYHYEYPKVIPYTKFELYGIIRF